jgi:hypothetical protein
MTKYRALLYSALVSAAASFAFLAIWYVFMWPTSDVRTRMYIIMYLPPGPAIPLLVVGALLTFLGGVCAWLTGWRGLQATFGALLGGAFGAFLLWSRLLGLFVWLHDEDVSMAGQLGHAALALAPAVVAFWLALRGSRATVAA